MPSACVPPTVVIQARRGAPVRASITRCAARPPVTAGAVATEGGRGERQARAPERAVGARVHDHVPAEHVQAVVGAGVADVGGAVGVADHVANVKRLARATADRVGMGGERLAPAVERHRARRGGGERGGGREAGRDGGAREDPQLHAVIIALRATYWRVTSGE